MTIASLILYVAAVIAGLILYGLFKPKNEKENGGSDTYRYPKRHKVQPSIFALLGLQEYNSKVYFFAFEDHFQTFEEVTSACRRAGLEKCQLIIGIDFTASNEWQGRKTFGGQCLHRIITGKIYNPYQKVISILGKTLEPFDEDKLIPAFGFGDSRTLGHSVFNFDPSKIPCKGFLDVLDKYNESARKVTLGGPTNFAPLISKAIEIVKAKSSYHILIIIADGQVNEEQETIDAIVQASDYPLSIVVVGVGDGPWDVMEEFDNCLPKRKFDNFQFVNFHAVTSKSKYAEAMLALHALMEIPDQYKTIKTLGYLSMNPKCESEV